MYHVETQLINTILFKENVLLVPTACLQFMKITHANVQLLRYTQMANVHAHLRLLSTMLTKSVSLVISLNTSIVLVLHVKAVDWDLNLISNLNLANPLNAKVIRSMIIVKINVYALIQINLTYYQMELVHFVLKASIKRDSNVCNAQLAELITIN